MEENSSIGNFQTLTDGYRIVAARGKFASALQEAVTGALRPDGRAGPVTGRIVTSSPSGSSFALIPSISCS
jgi:hypothetical protein